MYGQSSIPREAAFTTTERQRIGHRIGHLYDRLLLWRAAACDLSPAEHLIYAAHPTWRGYGLGQIALDYWDHLTQQERDVILAKGDARHTEPREETIRKAEQRLREARRRDPTEPTLADLLGRKRPLPPPVEADDMLWLFGTPVPRARLRELFTERRWAPVIPIARARHGDDDAGADR